MGVTGRVRLHFIPSEPPTMPAGSSVTLAPGGVKSYYQAKIEAAEILINQKTQNLRRLEAQRNALNARGGCRVFIGDDDLD